MDVSRDLPSFFERCTMEARRAVFHARHEVDAIGGGAISPEHLLLGLLQADVKASRLLVDLPLSVDRLRERFASLFRPSPRTGDDAGVPLSPESERVLSHAWASATSIQDAKVQSDHILLGILAEGGTPAADLLRSLGLTPEGIRSQALARDPDEDEE